MATELNDLITSNLDNLSLLTLLYEDCIQTRQYDKIITTSKALKTSAEALEILYKSQEIMAISPASVDKLIQEIQSFRDAAASSAAVDTLRQQLAEAQSSLQKASDALVAEQSAHAQDVQSANQKISDAVSQAAALQQQLQQEDDAFARIQSAVEGDQPATTSPTA